MAMTKKFADLEAILAAQSTDELIIHDAAGVKKISVENFKKDLVQLIEGMDKVLANVTADGAGAHNSIYHHSLCGRSVQCGNPG